MDLYELASRQHSVFSTWQAAGLGETAQDLRNRSRKGVIERVAPEVFRVRGTPDSWHQRVAVAVLSVPNSVASHRTAAALWELDGFEPGVIEVTVERWARRRNRDFLVHETKDLAAADLDERHGIGCTSLVRTLIDLPAVSFEFRCGQALDHACRRDRSVLEHVRHRHVEVARRGRNGTVVMRSLLERRGAGDRPVGSGFERRALDLIENAGLPAPTPQWHVRDGDFVAYLDLAWPDRMVGMECDSLAHHFGERAHQWDRTRRRHLTALGWDMYEFTYEDVTKRGSTVARELRAALT